MIQRGQKRRGMSMVEVLLVLGVMVVGLSLALPAIRAAQVRSRRASCINNLKMIGLALHNYHAAMNCFPMSAVAGAGHGNGHSGFTLLLPYMEHVPVYNAYNFQLENWHAANGTVTRTRIQAFLCPDNQEVDSSKASEVKTLDGKSYPGMNEFAKVHYGFNWGGGHEATGDDFRKTKGQYLGLLMTVITPEGKEKAKVVGIADVPDGTAFTLAAVEKRDGFGWAVGGWGGSEFDVNTTPNDAGADATARKVLTGSTHATGPNRLMADGSVRFVRPTIKKEIWYALMTRAEGEQIPFEAIE